MHGSSWVQTSKETREPVPFVYSPAARQCQRTHIKLMLKCWQETAPNARGQVQRRAAPHLICAPGLQHCCGPPAPPQRPAVLGGQAPTAGCDLGRHQGSQIPTNRRGGGEVSCEGRTAVWASPSTCRVLLQHGGQQAAPQARAAAVQSALVLRQRVRRQLQHAGGAAARAACTHAKQVSPAHARACQQAAGRF